MNDTTNALPHNDNDAERRRTRWLAYWLLIAMAGGLGASSILRVQPLLSANDRSRWCTVRALVDEGGTYQIDNVIVDPRTNWDTIDKVRHKEHFYSSKPALFPMLVAGVYWSVQRVSDWFDGEKGNGWTLEKKPAETTRAILLIVNLLPMLGALFVFACILERYARRDSTRLFVMAAASLGTLLTTFLVTLNNHTIAAYSLVFALYPAMRILTDGERKWHWFALSGFFAAFVCTNELPAALFGVLMFLLLAKAAFKQTAAFFVPAALVPLGAYFYTNYLATGGLIPFYAYYGTEKYEYIYEGKPSYWMNPTGIDANTESPWTYFFHCTLGHHGLLSLSPVFLLTLAGWFRSCFFRDNDQNPRAERSRVKGPGSRGKTKVAAGESAPGPSSLDPRPSPLFNWLGIVLTLAVLGFYLSRTANYNYGGNTAGLRWMFWLTPFWLIGMIPIFDAWAYCRWFRGTAIALLVVSVFSATYSLSNPWSKPWLFSLMERWELIDYSTKPQKSKQIQTTPNDKVKPTTWFRTLPKSKDPQNPEWIRFEGFDADGNRIELTLEDNGSVKVDGRDAHRIKAVWKQTGEEDRVVTYDIDEDAFSSGATPSRFLIAVHGEERERALTFLRGLPGPKKYSLGKFAKLETYLPGGAIRCRKGAARVLHHEEGSPRRSSYRCDTWLSDRVPFGVVQVIITVRDDGTDEFEGTNEILALRHLIAVAASSIRK